MSNGGRCSLVIVAVVVAACGVGTPSGAATRGTGPIPPGAAPTPSLWRSVAAPAAAPSSSEWIAIDTFDGTPVVARVERPPKGGPWPIVVLLHPAGGLHARQLELASMFPKEGFLTLTPCWQRWVDARDTELLGCSPDAPDRKSAAEVVRDVMAVVDAARTLPGARPDRVALVGHSAGAMAGILTGSMGGRIDCVVAISAGYGTAIRAQWGTAVPDQVDGLAVPLLIVHGTNDTNNAGTNVATARAYEKTALEKGKKVESIYVQGAPHMLPYIAEYWTADVQARVLAFIARNLTG